MPADALFDTTVLVYVATENDPRSVVAEKLLLAGGVVSVQGLNEFVSVVRRKMRMRWEAVEELVSAMLELCGEPVPTTVELHKSGLQIAKRYGYHIYDSLIIAAAQDRGCTTLYSEDMQHGQRIGSLTICNPFLA